MSGPYPGVSRQGIDFFMNRGDKLFWRASGQIGSPHGTHKKGIPGKNMAVCVNADGAGCVSRGVDEGELVPAKFELLGQGGVITINIAEAEHSAREEMREKMNEQYRTLLGHFRHESGHYYWERLVADNGRLDAFRALFGHETDDYQAAIARHYGEGPPADWPNRFVSAYASMHPWEDWAETWAHYLHMVDTLETAADHGFHLAGRPLALPFDDGAEFDAMLGDWKLLSSAMNDLNRSMGLPDAYPFGLPDPAVEKLRFVHQVVRGC